MEQNYLHKYSASIPFSFTLTLNSTHEISCVTTFKKLKINENTYGVQPTKSATIYKKNTKKINLSVRKLLNKKKTKALNSLKKKTPLESHEVTPDRNTCELRSSQMDSDLKTPNDRQTIFSLTPINISMFITKTLPNKKSLHTKNSTSNSSQTNQTAVERDLKRKKK